MFRSFRRLFGLIAVGYGIYLAVLRPWHVRWGATDEEASEVLPGDNLVPAPKLNTTRAVAVNAPASAIWPWIVQIGQGRGGLYSYDWLENLTGLNLHSADRIIPELQQIKPGDTISLAPDNAMPLRVEVMHVDRALVLRTLDRQTVEPVRPGDYFKGEIAGTWAFVLNQLDDGTTRMIFRWRADWAPSLTAWLFNYLFLEPAHFVMERKMMLGIKERAERSSREGGRG